MNTDEGNAMGTFRLECAAGLKRARHAVPLRLLSQNCPPEKQATATIAKEPAGRRCYQRQRRVAEDDDLVASWGATLRSRTAGSQDESPSRAIHKQRPYRVSPKSRLRA
jgi:hypothetical protein